MTASYDPYQDPEYRKWQEKLEEARKNKPQAESGFSQETERLYGLLKDRKAFSYDVNADALYRQYRDQYAAMGALAMEEASASAREQTGGYGNSYAQSAAQQAYQKYLGQLGDKALSLYDKALERYRLEGQTLQERYRLAQELEEGEYQRYSDALASYSKDLSFLQGQADQAWQRGYQQYLQHYQQQKDSYDRLVALMEKRGYEPTDQELAAAGMTRAQADSILRR